MFSDSDIWMIFFDTLARLSPLEKTQHGKKLSAGDLTAVVRRKIANDLITVSTERSDAVPVDTIVVSAFFDLTAEDDEQSIEITLVYNSDQKYFFIEKLEWDAVSYHIAEGLCHELVHLNQHMNQEDVYVISDPPSHDNEYIGSDSEIQAYGFSIASESFLFGVPYQETEMFQVYENAFDEDSKVMLKLRYEIMKYLQVAEQLS